MIQVLIFAPVPAVARERGLLLTSRETSGNTILSSQFIYFKLLDKVLIVSKFMKSH